MLHPGHIPAPHALSVSADDQIVAADRRRLPVAAQLRPAGLHDSVGAARETIRTALRACTYRRRQRLFGVRDSGNPCPDCAAWLLRHLPDICSVEPAGGTP